MFSLWLETNMVFNSLSFFNRSPMFVLLPCFLHQNKWNWTGISHIQNMCFENKVSDNQVLVKGMKIQPEVFPKSPASFRLVCTVLFVTDWRTFLQIITTEMFAEPH